MRFPEVPVYCERMAKTTKPIKATLATVHSDRDILGGTPVFRGTRVPFQTLMNYLGSGHSLDDFLMGFPSVTRKQALAALSEAKEALLEKTRAA
jgi:uncharacterized protein (DUF433 family)